MKVLVTGGLGFIGSCVVRLLCDMGHSVVIFDDESSGHNYYDHNLVSVVIGDITNPSDLDRIPSDVTHCIHLAAAISVAESMQNPEKYMRINVEGSRNVLQWAYEHKLEAMCSASSAAVYGDPIELPLAEECKLNPISPYAQSKLDMEHLHVEFFNKGLRTSCFRFFNVFGERQDPKSDYSGVISKFFYFAKNNLPITIFGDGEQTRDFVYVQDVANALILYLLSENSNYDVYNIGTETVTTVNVLAKTIIDVAGATSSIQYLEARSGDIKHSLSNSSKLKSHLPWQPKMSLQEGLARTYQWFLETQ
ncbi:hypothetical protein RCL1_007389 [Eukaryota sp. TZLM3-RCL]